LETGWREAKTPRAWQYLWNGIRQTERKDCYKEDIAFAAFGGWDAYVAKNFGYSRLLIAAGLPMANGAEEIPTRGSCPMSMGPITGSI